jgi:hypothetical protein
MTRRRFPSLGNAVKRPLRRISFHPEIRCAEAGKVAIPPRALFSRASPALPPASSSPTLLLPPAHHLFSARPPPHHGSAVGSSRYGSAAGVRIMAAQRWQRSENLRGEASWTQETGGACSIITSRFAISTASDPATSDFRLRCVISCSDPDPRCCVVLPCCPNLQHAPTATSRRRMGCHFPQFSFRSWRAARPKPMVPSLLCRCLYSVDAVIYFGFSYMLSEFRPVSMACLHAILHVDLVCGCSYLGASYVQLHAIYIQLHASYIQLHATLWIQLITLLIKSQKFS